MLATSHSVGGDLVNDGFRPQGAYQAAPHAKDGFEVRFPLEPEAAGALSALTAFGLRYRESRQVEFAIDSEDHVVAVSAEIDPRDDSWLTSEELAAMWQQHVRDVEGFIHGAHAYRIAESGRFERVIEKASPRVRLP